MEVKVKDSRIVHRGRVFTMYEETLEFADGHTAAFSYVRHPGACVMVPFVDGDTMLMIKQYRHAIGRYIWEFPAGTMNPGEEPLVCAHRELIEETGFAAKSMDYWGEVYPLPSYSSEGIHVYKAYNLETARQNLDADEILSVHRVKLEEAMLMAKTGEIIDGKTLACLLLINLHC